MRSLALIAGICLLASLLPAQHADISWLRAIHHQRPTSWDPSMKFITASASPVSMMCPSIVFGTGWVMRDSTLRRKGLYIGASMATSAVVTLALKHSIQRDRPFVTYPDIQRLSQAGSPSFPSGHTSNAFATATAMTLAFPKWYVAAPAFLWAGTVGYTRMHLGVHYPSDVLVGAAIGAGSAWLCHFLNRRLFPSKHPPQHPRHN